MQDQPFSLEVAAREAGPRVALHFAGEHGEGSFTYQELSWAGAQHEARLAELTREGRVVALVATPTRESVSAFFAALDARHPVLLLHPRLPQEKRRRSMERVGASALWDGSSWERTELPPSAIATPDGAAVFLETSGSTGEPKLVLHTRASLRSAAEASASNLGWAEAGDRWLLSLPFSHVGGLSILLRCFLGRQTTVIAPLHTADPTQARALLEALDISLVSLVPTQLHRLLLDARFRFPAQVRAVLIGGAKLTSALRRRAEARDVPLVSTYGMTEFCSQITTERPGEPGEGVGLPLPGTEVRISETGRILVRGPTACLGYFGLPSPFDEDGWFLTSDRGRFDERGHLHVLGRTDHMIITGGENVHPEMIEAELLAEPSVREAAVLGLPDEDWGERVIAAIVPHEPSTTAPDFSPFQSSFARELDHSLRSRLPSYALPKCYVLVRELPLLGIGKLDRARLKDEIRERLSKST